ncbi:MULTISPECIES: ABC transporter permease [Leuconostoc]|jgi:simple sugar transport system permease protein|uniref:ABC transporter permease n=1 Tax=Leuconostoc pseudomesenteroides TaxID=33968 RepID=A0A5B8SW36_LEUPS|nr:MULTISPECIES: ABC transporter permease [Leuconostoc]MCC8440592.1 ABC transporter permease [Leuconostoc pseudomesenteroides]MCT4387560.1 ABC transporter permease [Leuconostoc pseudomesenteroides]MDG9734226.1 ABC transporter permease [Leuconostoc pseudomesenteroides]MDN2451569.1 ABC transporter permease [Leuconostoc sp. UCMA20149]NKZ36419.1 ABC transporter permease [Leuconostoc pseudomesenteroides]
MVVQKNNFSVALFSVLFGLIVGAIIMLVFGYNPISGYIALISSAFGSMQDIGGVLTQMTPLILTALGFTVASTAGFFNIGLSGQALAGWVGAVWYALSFPDMPAFVMIPSALILGTALGAVAGLIPGWLRAQFGASEVIVTIMMNYILLFLGNNILQNTMAKSIKESAETTKQVGHNASLQLKWLTDLTQGSSVSTGIFIALIMIVVVWFVMKKTTLGFEITAVGLNPDAAKYAGVSAKRTAVVAMAISGGLAGLAGTIEGLGNYLNFFTQNSSPSIGFDGMAVALLGGGSYLGILGAAALFSVLKIGGLGMPMSSGVPFELVDIVIASIIFFVGANYLIRLIQKRIKAMDEKAATQDAAKKSAKVASKQAKGGE